MDKGLEPWVQLVLFLVREESQGSSAGGSSSDWAPYHTSLPAGTPSSPLFWDDELLSMLEGTQCLANTMGYRSGRSPASSSFLWFAAGLLPSELL